MKHEFDLHRSRHAARNRRGRRMPHRLGAGADAGFRPRDIAAMLIAGVVGGFGWAMLPSFDRVVSPPSRSPVLSAPISNAPAGAVRLHFGLCHTGGGANCVVDGDTFWMEGTRIRIADIDTPETHPARCDAEASLGAAATRRLQTLLNGGAVALHPIDRDTDRYGRKLRTVSVDGHGVGDTMIAEGLARPYAGRPRAGWCG